MNYALILKEVTYEFFFSQNRIYIYEMHNLHSYSLFIRRLIYISFNL